LRFSYSSSINRPGITYLNPTVNKSSTTIEFGNPNLVSAHNRSFGMRYQHVGSRFVCNIGSYLNFANNGIGVYNYAGNDVIYRTYSNSNRYRHFQNSLYIQWMLSAKTSFVFNVDLSYKHFKSPLQNCSTNGWGGFFYGQVTQRLPWKVQLTLAYNVFNYGHNVMDAYSYSHSPDAFFSAALQRSFLKGDRLSVRIGFESFHKYMRYDTYKVSGDYKTNTKVMRLQRTIGLKLTYRFGKESVQMKTTEKKIENDDQVGGIKMR